MTVTVVSCVMVTVIEIGHVDSPGPPKTADGEAGGPECSDTGASDGAAPDALSTGPEGAEPPEPLAALVEIGDSPPIGKLAKAVDTGVSSTVMNRVL